MKFSIALITICLLQTLTLNAFWGKSVKPEEMEARADAFYKKFGITILYESFPEAGNSFKYELIDQSDYDDLHEFVDAIDEQFSKFPEGFLSKDWIERIILVDSFEDVQEHAGVAQTRTNTLIYDINKTASNRDNYRDTSFHSKLFNLLDEHMLGKISINDPEWDSMNSGKARYGLGGAMANYMNRNTGYSQPNFIAPEMSRFNHPADGFVNDFARASIPDDKAELFSALMITDIYEDVMEWTKTDSALKYKVLYMMHRLHTYNDGFTPEYWEELHGKKFIAIAPAKFKKDLLTWNKLGIHLGKTQDAAALGDPEAQFRLGRMLYFGKHGGEPVYQGAFGWFSKASKQGHVEATYFLGSMFILGQYVPKNFNTAFKLNLAAAKKDYVPAIRNVGLMLKDGLGVDADHIIALQWLGKGAKMGDASAQQIYDDLKASFTPQFVSFDLLKEECTVNEELILTIDIYGEFSTEENYAWQEYPEIDLHKSINYKQEGNAENIQLERMRLTRKISFQSPGEYTLGPELVVGLRTDANVQTTKIVVKEVSEEPVEKDPAETVAE